MVFNHLKLIIRKLSILSYAVFHSLIIRPLATRRLELPLFNNETCIRLLGVLGGVLSSGARPEMILRLACDNLETTTVSYQTLQGARYRTIILEIDEILRSPDSSREVIVYK